jgi:hypothetical protein
MGKVVRVRDKIRMVEETDRFLKVHVGEENKEIICTVKLDAGKALLQQGLPKGVQITFEGRVTQDERLPGGSPRVFLESAKRVD